MSTEPVKRRNPGHRWSKGESGNPEGRPKTSRRKLADRFISDLLESWQAAGKEVIERLQAKFPDVYAHAVGSLVQKGDRFRGKRLIDEHAVFAARFAEARADLHAAAIRVSSSAAGSRQHENATNRLAEYRPYPKQAEFHAAGVLHDERLLMAGNQLGKTLAGAMEWAMHLTGRYPDGGRERCSTSRCGCGRRVLRPKARATILSASSSARRSRRRNGARE